jgi:hypothetical protein
MMRHSGTQRYSYYKIIVQLTSLSIPHCSKEMPLCAVRNGRQSSSAETAEAALLRGFKDDQLGEEVSVMKRVHEEKFKVAFHDDLD